MYKILIAEDDSEIAMLEQDYLEIDGFETRIIQDGNSVHQLLNQEHFDLLILDIMLPGKNGYELCKEIRAESDVPILMVTAKTESIDKIRGLGLGADDYISKPFDPAELVARVKAHIARYERLVHHNNEKTDNIIQIGHIKILKKSWKVFVNNEEVKFPNKEFEVLVFLAENANIVFSKEQIFEKIWGYGYIGDSSTVTVHINRIREKIEEDSNNPKIIETVWGAGYRLNLI
ncbi:response regulator transcription factor [Rummeliibacillus pycnus]|uniref:response regulator transcription factor n=1 Tax=Rummeliibacillus pycnus TaxID=101070 RepID=UPI000C99943B|nr:response regulator transcription factor [Rummeliibacillus pycnus]